MFFELFSKKRMWITLIASCLRFENFRENNVYFFRAQVTCISSYSSIQHYVDGRAIVFHSKKNKNLELGCVPKWSQWDSMRSQFCIHIRHWKNIANIFSGKSEKRHLIFGRFWIWNKKFSVTFIIISFILNAKCKHWITIFLNIRNGYNDQIINPLLAVLLEHVVFSVCFSFC